jgi:dipeptidyl aminopeptidase/acylaminoacyl peptidase
MTSHLRIQAANGVGGVDSLAFTNSRLWGLYDWSDLANTILIGCGSPVYDWDVWVIPMDDPKSARPFLQSPFNERGARRSPDGHWLAYSSDESGREEVYVVPYPHVGGKRQVSTAGGSYPQWRADGKELFFQGPDQSIMAVSVGGGSSFEASPPKRLFKAALARGFNACAWAVSRDGQRFIVNTPVGAVAAEHFVVAMNWATELRRK